MTAATFPQVTLSTSPRAAAPDLAIDPSVPWGLSPDAITATLSALASWQPLAFQPIAGELPDAFATRCDSWDDYVRLLADDRLGLQIDPATGLAVQMVSGIMIAGASPARELWCGLFDLNRIATALSRATTDEAITALVFVWDSPGGYSPGITSILSTLAELRAGRPALPILSYVPRQCGSLAYWIASGTQEIHCNPDAMVGCIGSFILSQDSEQNYLNEGLLMKLHTSGLFKGMGAPGIKWDPAWYEELDKRVRAVSARFEATVLAHRPGVTADQMTGLFYEAQSAGALVDSTDFASTDQFLAAVIGLLPKRV